MAPLVSSRTRGYFICERLSLSILANFWSHSIYYIIQMPFEGLMLLTSKVVRIQVCCKPSLPMFRGRNTTFLGPDAQRRA